MAGRNSALLISTQSYRDPTFRRLRAPVADARALATVLSDPRIGGYAVDIRRNVGEPEATRVIEDFFSTADPDDLLLFYVSGHGVKDDAGQLYLAVADSRHDRLGATTVPALFVRDQMNRSRARRIVIWLDCCYAGAFPAGLRHRGAEQADVVAQFGAGGYAVMTSSSALEYAYEPAAGTVTRKRTAQPSVFTGVLTEGLRTGDADLDGDGRIDIDELYDYVYERVRAVTPGQTPQKNADQDGKLYIAASVRGPRPSSVLPADIVRALGSPRGEGRLAAVASLAVLAASADQVMAGAARTALAELAVGTGLSARRAREALDGAAENGTRRRRGRHRIFLGAALAALAAAATGTGVLLSQPSYTIRTVATLSDPAGNKTISFSPNGDVLASADDDGTIRLWDVSNLARPGVVARLPAGESHDSGWTTLAAFSPDGHMLATLAAFPDQGMTAVGEHGMIRLWDIANPARAKLVWQQPLAMQAQMVLYRLDSLAFSRNHVLAVSDNNGTIWLWDVTSPAHPKAMSLEVGPTVDIDSLAFSPDGDILAAGTYGASFQTWNVADPASIYDLGQPASVGGVVPHRVLSVVLRPGSHVMASVDDTGDVRLWEVSDQEPATATAQPLTLGQNTNSDAGVDALAFSPSGNILASGDSDGTLRLWNVTDPAHPALLDQPVAGVPYSGSGTWIGAVAFSPNRPILATSEDSDNDNNRVSSVIRLWQVPPEPQP